MRRSNDCKAFDWRYIDIRDKRAWILVSRSSLMFQCMSTARDCIKISRKMKSLYMYIDIDTSAFSLSMECFGHHLGRGRVVEARKAYH